MAPKGLLQAAAFALLIGTSLSGCIVAESTTSTGADKGTAGQAAPEAAAPAEFDETSGAISGVVINEEGLPLGGALAGIRETAAQTVADVAGTFTFSNLAPGEYSVDVSQLGYESTSRRVTVTAGEITHINVALQGVAVEEAYHETILENGNIQCSVRAYPGVPTGGTGGLPRWTTGVAVCGLVGLPGFADDRFLIDYDVPTTVIEMVVEMEWSSTQAAGSALSFVLEHNCCANSADNTFGRDEGKSPLAIYVNASTMLAVAGTSEKDCFADGCTLMTRVFAEAETTGIATPVPLGPFPDPLGDPRDRVDVGLTLDQRFVQYLTHFHLEGMPDGFTALADD